MKHLPTTNKPLATLDLVKSEAVKAHLGNPTIRNIHPDDLTDPLNALILMIAQKQGLKVDAVQVQDVSSFVCKYFKDFTLEEVKLAFEYYNAKKLNTPQGFGAYGLLSQEFFGGVLKAFRDYRTEEMRKENANLSKSRNITTKNKVRKKNTEAIRKGVLQAWAYFQENERMERDINSDLVSVFYYDYLRDLGLIQKPDEETTEAIKQEARSEYEQAVKNRQASASSPLDLKQINHELQNMSKQDKARRIQTLCKKIAVRIYFEECLFNEVNLKELVENS